MSSRCHRGPLSGEFARYVLSPCLVMKLSSSLGWVVFVFLFYTEDVMMSTNTRELVNKTKVKTKLHQHTVATKLRTRLNVVSMPKSQFQHTLRPPVQGACPP